MLATQPSLPPGPKAPALWQLFRIADSPLPFLENCARCYGDAFTLWLARLPSCVVLANPEAVRNIFRGDTHVLHGAGNWICLGMTLRCIR